MPRLLLKKSGWLLGPSRMGPNACHTMKTRGMLTSNLRGLRSPERLSRPVACHPAHTASCDPVGSWPSRSQTNTRRGRSWRSRSALTPRPPPWSSSAWGVWWGGRVPCLAGRMPELTGLRQHGTSVGERGGEICNPGAVGDPQTPWPNALCLDPQGLGHRHDQGGAAVVAGHHRQVWHQEVHGADEGKARCQPHRTGVRVVDE